jgi:quercetin dioxygenase-like cupin family protein
MQTQPIADARRFSLRAVQEATLVAQVGLSIELLCFEAGQRFEGPVLPSGCVYQVLEGEAIVREPSGSTRLGKGVLGVLAAGAEHTIENAGGGLLVVMRTHRA